MYTVCYANYAGDDPSREDLLLYGSDLSQNSNIINLTLLLEEFLL